MTQTVLVAGTASHVGKSTVVAGLCRRLSQQGFAVAPFKAQNMSNNARAVVTPGGDWGEIGVSQYVQARAAAVPPTTDMNPVLLKPRGDGESQLVIGGHAVCNVKAGAFYDDHWQQARRAVFESHERLAAEYDLIIAEGAGSIAEINLHEHDLANVETARLADATIVLVADIDRGGAFASLYGTLELMPEDLRDRVAGMVINKFRGDGTILTPGITELEALTNVPVIGVLPHDDPDLPEEDSVSLTDHDRSTPRDRGQCGRDGALTIAVPRLPHISNFTDLEPLGRIPRVRVDYIPLQDSLGAADAVVIPGTKNTVDDLHAITEAGLDEELRQFDGPIVGVCGGYQMLGKRLLNSDIEGTGPDAVVDGVGLLPVETRFSQNKCVRQVEVPVSGTGPIDGASGTATGYEIHMGRTYPLTALAQPLGENSAATSFVLGTYLHGLFENESIWSAFLDVVSREAETSWEKPSTDRPTPYTQAANLVDSIEMACFHPGE